MFFLSVAFSIDIFKDPPRPKVNIMLLCVLCLAMQVLLQSLVRDKVSYVVCRYVRQELNGVFCMSAANIFKVGYFLG
jgi:hypothetical protein